MSAATLRRAAALMREQHGPDHERHEMWVAMAALLDDTAESWEMCLEDQRFHLATYNITVGYTREKALNVARTYLGETS